MRPPSGRPGAVHDSENLSHLHNCLTDEFPGLKKTRRMSSRFYRDRSLLSFPLLLAAAALILVLNGQAVAQTAADRADTMARLLEQRL